MTRLVGFVIRGIFCRTIIGVGIDSENRKITRVSGPDPIVGILTIAANRCRRRTHEPHIPVCFSHKQEILITMKKRLDIGFLPGFPTS